MRCGTCDRAWRRPGCRPAADSAQSFAALGALVERHRARDAGLDHHLIERLAALHGPAFELALLHVERLAVLGLGVGADAAVGESAARMPVIGGGLGHRIFPSITQGDINVTQLIHQVALASFTPPA